MKKLIFILFVLTNILKAEKILILTQVYNRPEFIEIQQRLYKKFLKDDYELIIYDNSDNEDITKTMQETCKKLNIRYCRVPQNIHSKSEGFNTPSERNANSINYSFFDAGIKHDGIVAIIASDIFIIKEFSIEKFLEGYDLAGLYQNRKHVNYIWDHIVFLRTNKLNNKEQIDFGCGYVDDILTDVGGKLYFYLKNHSQLKVKYLNQLYFKNSILRSIDDQNNIKIYSYSEGLKLFNLNNNFINFILSGVDDVELLAGKCFMHYRNGSMYSNHKHVLEYHKNKTNAAKTFFDLL